MATNLQLYINSTWVSLPKCAYTLGATDEDEYTIMASGKETVDVIGKRPTISATIEYIDSTTLSTIATWLKANNYTKVKYEDTTGTECERFFKISNFSPTVFAERNNKWVWTNYKIDMTCQEVVDV